MEKTTHEPCAWVGDGSLAIEIGRLVHEVVIDIFVNHRSEIVTGSAGFVVPAIWGDEMAGPLNESQKEVRAVAERAVHEVVVRLGVSGAERGKALALGFVVRELLATKLLLLVEMSYNQELSEPFPGEERYVNLRMMEPVGRA